MRCSSAGLDATTTADFTCAWISGDAATDPFSEDPPPQADNAVETNPPHTRRIDKSFNFNWFTKVPPRVA